MGLTDTFFGWLRRGACQAVLSGVADACDQLAAPDALGGDGAARLRLVLTPALPAPTDAPEADAPAKRKGAGRG